ncbi:hypothetical protein PanWU01x14_330330, partial [Parasponia andersonii]
LEPLHMVWERFKIRLSRESDHDLPKWYQLQEFMKGLNPTSRSWVEARYGFSICKERPEDEAYQMREDMVKLDFECFYFEDSSRELEEEEPQDMLVVEKSKGSPRNQRFSHIIVLHEYTTNGVLFAIRATISMLYFLQA